MNTEKKHLLKITHAQKYSSVKKIDIRELFDTSNHIIIFVKRGSVSVSTPGEQLLLSDNELYCSYAKNVISISAINSSKYEIYILLFSGSAADLITNELSPNFHTKTESHSDIPRQLEQICLLNSSILDKDAFYALRLLWNALGFITFQPIFRNSEDTIPPHVLAIQKLFHEKPTGSYSLDTLAASVHVNKFKLIKDFKEYFHMPPMQYLFELRINMAKELLVSTDLNITDIALASGFANSNYFIHAFKNKIGMSPTEFRQRARS